MPKTNSNTSSVTDGFARMNQGNDEYSIEFRVSFIQYSYIENNQKYIDIDYTSQEDLQTRSEGWG